MFMAGLRHRAEKSIAIVGMACEFPGAHTPEELWENVLAGRRFFRKAPAERMPPEYFHPDPKEPDKSYCDRMAVITGWEFDPLQFRIPPVTARASDIAHWLALWTADLALKDSGLDLASLDRTRAGVMLGNSLTGEFNRSHYLRLRWPYVQRALDRSLQAQGVDGPIIHRILAALRHSYEVPFPETNEDTLAGNMSNTIAGRVCNHFDLGGGGFTVDGACSSSLLSLVIACDALVQGDLDLALAGGVDVSLDPFEIVGFAKAQALARDDMRPYDKRADGMMTGEGCGILVLMREADARGRGLRIHALLKGWAYSSDGKGGITAPEVEGQARALRRAYDRAGYPMTSVGLIEGHGTGTPVGDKVELNAIQRVLQSGADSFQCTIGSIKANIGHCKAAAGAAGLIKAVQALKHKILPPTVNCERPINVFSQSGWRLRPSLKGKAWESKSAPRRASVSSMGFGGSNSHVTLEEANPAGVPSAEHLKLLGSHQSSELVLLSAPDAGELLRQVRQLLPIAERICLAEMTDLSAALAKRPVAGPVRLAIVTGAPWDLVKTLREVTAQLEPGIALEAVKDLSGGICAGTAIRNPTLVALFPGQGSQRLNMGERLCERYPLVRELFARVHGEVTQRMFRDTLGTSPEQVQEWETQLRATQVAQPAIVATSAATLQVLDFLGLRPTFGIGHSLGEITALHAAGAVDADQAIQIAAQRGQAMAGLGETDTGAMLAVAASPDRVQKLLAGVDDSVVISNYNSPRQTVVSGRTAAIHALKVRCEREQIRASLLPVSHAFHSDLVAPAAAEFRRALESIPFAPRTADGTRVVSTAIGRELPADHDLRELLGNHIRQPVRFVDAVQTAAAQKPDLWVEVGPGGVLTALVRDILGPDNVICLPTDLKDEDAHHLLNLVLARAFVLGFPVRPESLFTHRFHRPFEVENYHPIFIINPCERPVTLDVERLPEFGSGVLSASVPERRPTAPVPVSPPIAAAASDRESLLTFAVTWIAKRTGYPESVITPDKRLRDDLNLDSIKVGELVVLMAKQANRSPKGDPAALANATLTVVVETLLQQEPSDALQAAAAESRQIQLQSVAGLGEWVRTFRMAPAPAPIGAETPQPLPSSGSVVIVGEMESPRSKAIAAAIRQKGLASVFADVNNLLQAPVDLAALIVLLPTVETDFLRCSPAQFDERVEGFASRLFHIFRWAMSGTSGLRALVLRPAADAYDAAADFNAGAAFLKSLQLETAKANLKWLTLPEAWEAERWAATAMQELECSGRTAVCYSLAGERTAEVAHPLEAEPTVPPALGTEDVALVSGGGKGITFELALELTRQTGCKLALFGSSPPPAAGAAPDESELARNLGRLRQAGIVHAYFKCDVSDLDAVRRTVTAAEKQLGKVTAIFHGAGVTQLRALRDKPLDEFLNCIRIKTRGLYNLLTAVPPARLRALHVISSVLGNSGMRGQTDYTFANAWLDEAVRQIQTAHPHLHCLSLGYSVWADTGLGKRIGALETLRVVGVTPIGLQEGVAAYRRLVTMRKSGSRFIITGRLTADLEANLYPPPNLVPHRFLEKVLRCIPGTEIIADATLSHTTDLYLPEHVFEGTPLFPGVMAIEAMVQAATACVGREDLPVLRNIVLRRPLIVPEDATVVVRTLALAEDWGAQPPPAAATGAPAEGAWAKTGEDEKVFGGGAKHDTRGRVCSPDKAVCVRVAMCSDRDDFQENHFEAECWFGLPSPAPETLPACPPLAAPLDKNPEDFSPVPLFQGKFFRRITAIRKLETERESCTDVLVPRGERYFGKELPQTVITLSPATRDAFLQSGALVLPPGSLPERVREWRVLQPWQPGELLHIFAKCWLEGDNAFGGDIEIRNAAGELVERVEGALLRHSSTAAHAGRKSPPAAVPMERVSADLAELLAKVPHALAMVEHETVTAREDFAEVTRDEITALRQATAPARQISVIANVLATRRAVTECAVKHLGVNVSRHDVHLAHRPDGKPELRFTEAAKSKAFQALDISVADGGGLSVAWIGPVPVGVDIESVQARGCETWRGLLGDDGYALALRIERETRESFDSAATRVWTVLEAAKKACALRRVLPRLTGSSGSNWLAMSVESDADACRLLSALVENPDARGRSSAIAVALGNKLTAGAEREVPAKYQSVKSVHRLRLDYSGPQDQMLATKRFPVLFRDCQTASKNVEFTRYVDWMGNFREEASTSLFVEMIERIASERWGMATNHYRLKVLGVLSPGDIVEAKLWQERAASENLWLLKFDWRAIHPNGRTSRVALSQMEFSAVKILAHGVAQVDTVPEFMKEFFEEMLPALDAAVKPLELLPCGYERLQLGPLLWQGASLAGKQPAPFTHEILTTSENSNWVGNIYYANYGEWMARVRDLYFYRLTPDCFRNSGRDGEWVCLWCAIDHLSEAMPFDRILVTMDVAAIHRSGIDLTFDYFLLENNQIARKLAHGKHTMAWVGRDARNEPVALELPRNVVETLTRELRQK
jgi:enediyne polyketide synthase